MHTYEDIIDETLVSHYCYKYQLSPDDFYAHLWLNTLLRNMAGGKVNLYKKGEAEVRMGAFLLTDLHIQINAGRFFIDDRQMDATLTWGSPIRNSLDNHAFQLALCDDAYEIRLKKDLATILKNARKQMKDYEKTAIKEVYYQRACLRQLDERFQKEPQQKPNQCLKVIENHEDDLEKIQDTIRAFESKNQTSIRVSEAEVEQYLLKNLDVLEEGLRPIQRQVILPNGRIDIWARDKQGQDVLIEVKVENDTDLVWQRSYYESEWKKKANVRFMVVSTELAPHLMAAVLAVGPTTFFEITPVVKENKIVTATIRKI